MNKIKIKDKYIRVDTFDWQEGSLGLKFRLLSIEKNLQVPEKYLKGSFKNHWIYSFIYESGKIFRIEIDYNDKFIGKC